MTPLEKCTATRTGLRIGSAYTPPPSRIDYEQSVFQKALLDDAEDDFDDWLEWTLYAVAFVGAIALSVFYPGPWF